MKIFSLYFNYLKSRYNSLRYFYLVIAETRIYTVLSTSLFALNIIIWKYLR